MKREWRRTRKKCVGALESGGMETTDGCLVVVPVRSQLYKPSLVIRLTAEGRVGGAGHSLEPPLPALGSGGQPLCSVAVAVDPQHDQMHARCIRSCNNTQHDRRTTRQRGWGGAEPPRR